MLARAVTLRFDPLIEAFDDSPLRGVSQGQGSFRDPRPFPRPERGALPSGARHLRPAAAGRGVRASGKGRGEESLMAEASVRRGSGALQRPARVARRARQARRCSAIHDLRQLPPDRVRPDPGAVAVPVKEVVNDARDVHLRTPHEPVESRGYRTVVRHESSVDPDGSLGHLAALGRHFSGQSCP